MIKRISEIKGADNYSDDEITNLIQMANNAWEYDYIIDRLYFYNRITKKHRKNEEYEVLTARTISKRSRKDLLPCCDISELRDVERKI